jgi:transposase
MITMATIREIKTWQAQGWSRPAIAPAVHVARKTVRK